MQEFPHVTVQQTGGGVETAGCEYMYTAGAHDIHYVGVDEVHVALFFCCVVHGMAVTPVGDVSLYQQQLFGNDIGNHTRHLFLHVPRQQTLQ
jgi:hypothetical protein